MIKDGLLSITGFCATNILDRVPGGLDFLEVHDEIRRLTFIGQPVHVFVSVDAFHVQGGLFRGSADSPGSGSAYNMALTSI